MSDLTTLAVGHITHDRLKGRIWPGGCAYYASGTWRALGARTRLATVVGADFACNDALDGLELWAAREGRTTGFRNLYPETGPRIQFIEAEAPAVVPHGLPDDWRQADVMFLGPVIDELDAAAWLDAVNAKRVAIGVQGFVRRAVEGESEQGSCRRIAPKPWVPEAALLERIHVACLSEEDLLGQVGLLERLCAHIPLVALTRERRGCDLIRAGRRTWIGIHPARVVDPTGAGDSFAAGFLLGLSQDMDPVHAARLGAACASIVIEGRAGESFSRMAEAYARARVVPP